MSKQIPGFVRSGRGRLAAGAVAVAAFAVVLVSGSASPIWAQINNSNVTINDGQNVTLTNSANPVANNTIDQDSNQTQTATQNNTSLQGQAQNVTIGNTSADTLGGVIEVLGSGNALGGGNGGDAAVATGAVGGTCTTAG